MVLERLLWHVTCPNHASFHLLTVAKEEVGGDERLVKLELACKVDILALSDPV